MTTQTANQRERANPTHHLQLLARVLASLAGLLGEEVLVDVRQNTTLGNGDVTKELVQFLVVSDGELEVTRDDTGLLVVTSSVASQLKNFGREVLENGSQIDGSAGTDSLGVVALSEKTVDTTYGESQTGLGGSGLCILGPASLSARFATASHLVCVVNGGIWGV